MNRRIAALIALGAGAVLVASACSDVSIELGDDQVAGSGRIVTESRDVDSFDRVVLAGEGDVVVTRSDAPSLAIETDDNLLEHIESVVSGGTLTLSTEDGIDIEPSLRVTYRIGMPELDGVELRGAGSFDVAHWDAPRLDVVLAGAGDVHIEDLAAGDLDVSLPGAGTIFVSGRVDRQTVELTGAGSYDASSLRSSRADVTSTGVGNATIWVEDRLDVRATGVGNIGYYGTPEISQQITGLGSIQSLGLR